MPSFGFSQVHIVESLPCGECHTGRVLRTSIINARPEDADRVHHHDVADASSLRSLLTAVGIEASEPDRLPYLHFECHGNHDGLVLASDELLSWSDLCDLLRPINVATRMNLFVSLAACYGERLVYAVSPVLAAPLWGLVGPRDAMAPGDLVSFFSGYFRSLLSDPSIERALGSEGGPPGAHLPIVYWSAAHFFEGLFEFYRRSEGTSDARSARADRIALQVLGPKADPMQRRLLARRIRRDLRDVGQWFEKYRRRYLMLEQFPENDERFPRSWEQVRDELSS